MMQEWLMTGNFVLKVAAIVALSLFSMNWICLMAGRKIGKVPLGDFVLIGLFMLVVFFNMDKLLGLAQCIPDGINILVGEVGAKTKAAKETVSEFQETVDETYSEINRLVNGALLQLDRLDYTVPE